ncbi:hypothetical protein [Azohydromonas aeria]|uniref:hypothetical protein n=1 Tax=Azohydromonas aeria TaxID=2590212 RepID=UPI0012FBF148|nr:hypothetical protein [Azohydromonas aeria]
MAESPALPAWQVRIAEYGETVAAVRGDQYMARLMLWCRTCYAMAEHMPHGRGRDVAELAHELGRELGLDDADTTAALALVLRAKNDIDALRDGRCA